MNIYLLKQTVNKSNWSFDSCIVAAENEKQARFMHPRMKKWDGVNDEWREWTDANQVTVEHIGKARKHTLKGVILASYNAG